MDLIGSLLFSEKVFGFGLNFSSEQMGNQQVSSSLLQTDLKSPCQKLGGVDAHWVRLECLSLLGRWPDIESQFLWDFGKVIVVTTPHPYSFKKRYTGSL